MFTCSNTSRTKGFWHIRRTSGFLLETSALSSILRAIASHVTKADNVFLRLFPFRIPSILMGNKQKKGLIADGQ